jgi:hypothetical protein
VEHVLVERVVVKAQQQQQHEARHHERQRQRPGHPCSPLPPLRPEPHPRQQRPRHRELHQQFARQEPRVLRAVEPSCRGRGIGLAVALAADDEPQLVQVVDGTGKGDQRNPGAPHHPCIGQQPRDDEEGEFRQLGEDFHPPRPEQGRVRRRNQQHQRPVVGERQPEEQRHRPQRPLAQRQVEQRERKQRVQRVHLRHDRLRPERRRQPQRQRRERRRQPALHQATSAQPQRRARGRAKQRAKQMHPVGHRAHRHLRRQPPQRRVQRIARRVRHPQEITRQDEIAVVFHHHRARRAQGIDGEERQRDKRGTQAVVARGTHGLSRARRSAAAMRARFFSDGQVAIATSRSSSARRVSPCSRRR